MILYLYCVFFAGVTYFLLSLVGSVQYTCPVVPLCIVQASH